MIHIRTTSRRARFHSISWRPDPPDGLDKAGEVLVGDSFDVITVENRQNMIEIEILGTATPGARNNARVTRFVGNTVRHVLDGAELGHSKSRLHY